MRGITLSVALVFAACGNGDRPGAVKTAETVALAADAGADALTDEQRNAIALEAFLAADRLATDSKRALLDAQARQAVEVRFVMQWLHAVRDKASYEDEFLDEEDRTILEKLMALNPQLDAEMIADGVRVSTEDDLVAAALESATLTFTLARDASGQLRIKKLVVDAPHDSGELGCFPEE